MKKKSRIVLIIILFLFLVYGCGITYSIFHAEKNMRMPNQKTAEFIFDSKRTDHLEFDLSSLTPSDKEEYTFNVTNTKGLKRSGVNIIYSFTIKTFHFMPLDIKLYKLVDDEEELILECDETYSRDEDNFLVCNSEEQEMKYTIDTLDEYVLKVSFLEGYDSHLYSELVDFISLDIKSYQKGGNKV